MTHMGEVFKIDLFISRNKETVMSHQPPTGVKYLVSR